MDRKTIMFITLHAISAAAAAVLAALALAGLAAPGSTVAIMLASAVLIPQAVLLLMAFMTERK